MATKKRAIGRRSRPTERVKHEVAKASLPPGTPIPTRHPAPEAPRSNRGLDPDEVQVNGREAGKAAAALHPESTESRSGGQAGSLQGLSDAPEAASESVDELLEEGNAFEAGIIKGVEDADDADRMEVKTHEIREDDVPEEYQHHEQ